MVYIINYYYVQVVTMGLAYNERDYQVELVSNLPDVSCSEKARQTDPWTIWTNRRRKSD